MKDLIATIWAIAIGITYAIAGYIYSDSPLYFPIHQSATFLLFGLCAWLSKAMTVPHIILCGFTALAGLEIVDEIMKVNTKTRMDDYLFLIAGVVGISYGIYRKRKQLL